MSWQPAHPVTMPDPDFRRLFDASPNPYLVLDRSLHIAGANKAYLAATKRELADIVGCWAWDAFPTDPETLKQSIASFERVIATGQPDTMALLRFDIPRPDSEGGGFEKRYWSITHSPVKNNAGEVEFVLQHPIDVTELESLRDAARHAEDDRPLDLVPAQTGIFTRAQHVYEANLSLKADSDRLRNLFTHAPGPIAVLAGPDHVFELANEAYFQLVGRRDIVGKPFLQALPELAGQEISMLLDQVFSTGKAFVGRGLQAALQQQADAPLTDVYYDVLIQPLLGQDGAVTGLFCQVNDVTDVYRAHAALRESRERLQEGMDAARMVIWDWDLRAGQVSLSENACEILGCAGQPDETIFRCIHPEDEPRVRDARLQATPAHPRYKTEFRFIRPDNGKTIWIEKRASVLFDASGAMCGVKGVALDITERKRAEKQIQDAAQHDSLTGLPNRALLNEYCAHILATAERSRTSGAVLFIDLDRFKPINDLYGHDAGDKVLQEVARRLLACTRKGDIVCRLGGDEFIIVLPDIASPHDPATVARHIISAIEQPIAVGALQLNVSPSIGISMFPEHASDLEALIRCADQAMYTAKKAGRNNFKMYVPGLNDEAGDLLRLEMRLKHSLESSGFALHYQPIVDMQTRLLTGVEALIRMPDEDGTLLNPAEFITVAEKAGLINRLGEWVVREACRQHRAWRESGLPPMHIAVNVSAAQFRQPAFASMITDALDEFGMEPSCLQIEVTESAVMDNIPDAAAKLGQLQALGVRIALDDFGTGYSSLSYLGSLPLDALKIDRSFILRMASSQRSRSITEAIVLLGRTLNLKVVGEGIESQEAMDYLLDYGCDQAQGFLFSAPLPAQQFEAWCRHH